MTRYRIDEEESALSIEVTEAGGRLEQLRQAFGECQAGLCSCPTSQYEKLVSMEVEQHGDLIRIRLQTKPGEQIDSSEVARCLDYTTAKAGEATAADDANQ